MRKGQSSIEIQPAWNFYLGVYTCLLSYVTPNLIHTFTSRLPKDLWRLPCRAYSTWSCKTQPILYQRILNFAGWCFCSFAVGVGKSVSVQSYIIFIVTSNWQPSLKIIMFELFLGLIYSLNTRCVPAFINYVIYMIYDYRTSRETEDEETNT